MWNAAGDHGILMVVAIKTDKSFVGLFTRLCLKSRNQRSCGCQTADKNHALASVATGFHT